MKIYNWILKTVLLLGIAGMFTSCEDMLKEKIYDFTGEFEDSNTGADQAAIGAYSKLLDDMFRWNHFPKVLEFDCDYITGPDWCLQYIGAGNFQVGGDDGTDNLWKHLYSLIYRANFAIESIEPMTNVTEAHKKNVIGEMKFLKAWAYFLLIRAYGDIPVFYQSINKGVDYNQPRQPVSKVYGHIIELLTEAEADMYKNTDGAYKQGRASAGAAASLLAKVYLTIGSASVPSARVTVKGGVPFTGSGDEKKFTPLKDVLCTKHQPVAGYKDFDSETYFKLARDKAKEVIDGKYGHYDLLPYSQLWTARGGLEHIWYIQPVAGDEIYGLQISLYYTGTENTSGEIITGHWVGCRDHWYKLFEDKDLRIMDGVMHKWRYVDQKSWNGGSFYPDTREWQIKAQGFYTDDDGNYFYNDENGQSFEVDPAFNDGFSYRCDKDYRHIAFLTKYYYASNRTQERTDVPWPVLRFADVLLIYAEAANETGQQGEALAALNKVRERSNATLKTPGDFAGKEDFRSFVLEERARELALEGDRRWDLIRWGIYLDVMKAIGGKDEVGISKSRNEKHLLYPIPSGEIETNKAITKNNPGW